MAADPASDRSPLEELPPSAKLVAKVLEREDEFTQSGIAEETLLSPRTVRAALDRLEENDVVASRRSFVDARRRIYWIRRPRSRDPRRAGGAPAPSRASRR